VTWQFVLPVRGAGKLAVTREVTSSSCWALCDPDTRGSQNAAHRPALSRTPLEDGPNALRGHPTTQRDDAHRTVGHSPCRCVRAGVTKRSRLLGRKRRRSQDHRDARRPQPHWRTYRRSGRPGIKPNSSSFLKWGRSVSRSRFRAYAPSDDRSVMAWDLTGGASSRSGCWSTLAWSRDAISPGRSGAKCSLTGRTSAPVRRPRVASRGSGKHATEPA
jgi:hypothetical protein